MPKVSQQRPPVKVSRGSNGKVPDVVSRIVPIALPDNGIQMAIYGRSGTGKTALACTFPKPLLLIRPPDDDGRRTIYKVQGVMDAPVYSVDELEQLTQHLVEVDGKYKTIVLDTMSALQELVLKKVLNVEELPAQMGWGVATQQQWGEVGSGMKELIRRLLQLQCNVLLLAQEREFNTDTNVTGVLAPYVNCGLSPTVASWVGPRVDYLVNTFIREGEREVESGRVINGKKVKMKVKEMQFCLRTGPHAVYNTKFRVPRGKSLPDVIVDPDYSKILKLIEG